MNMEESRRMAISEPGLRKKQLTSKLSAEEQQELDELLAIKAEAYPNRTEQQYAERVRLTAIRNFTIEDVTRKESLFQKMLKQGNVKEYKLKFLNEEEDTSMYDFHFTFALDIRHVMEEAGLGLDWPKMLPVDDGMSLTDPLEEDDKAWFESFPEPSWCASKFQEASGLHEIAVSHGEEMVQVIQWLQSHWEEGFQIYADIDPEEEDEWD